MLDKRDIKIETFRSRGNGGQNVNKVETAVRMTHIPTEIVVTSQNERSQKQNRKNAYLELEKRVSELEKQQKHEKLQKLRENQFKGRVRTYDFTKNLAIDHLSGKRVQLDKLLNGGLDIIR